jgi:glycolate oxidase iron-sulfur subunit
MCPSEVPFGELMEQARSLIHREQKGTSALPRLQQLLTEPHRIPGRLLRLYQQSGLQWLSRSSGLGHLLAGDMIELLPTLPEQVTLQQQYPAHGNRLGKVALFTGCLSQVIERQFLQDSILLLQAAGFEVHIPSQQVCCGAMHYHAGDTVQSDHLLQQNRDTFTAESWDAVIYLASGCGLFLHEHLVDATHDIPVTDIYRFLASHDQQLAFAPLAARVLLHLPCSLRQLAGAEQAVQELLQKIPGLQIQALAQNNICCGGAGNALLQQPQLARSLRARKAAILEQEQPADYVLTANSGCYIQFSRAIREHKLLLQVIHPVTLLAQQQAVP